ncbi:U3 small nucleolar ribonucleoprotein protein MPP10-like [Zingiber officinale]|uniref:U3 small nucleolar ribonucleoprotein protein MPP10-like n=1 Tax=Zingiber officinale TaxID=94328 RepID=UPI001C4CF9DA|nr:U3 small nucleolar ribonucleoprotein protein MPP10-like [Zingiber officinale]
MLFKKISLKLDALSHFHFAPKLVIEDMSIQVNVPAVAMEEVAPLVVSNAAMLAPKEIFHGKGNIKEEAELTKEERKRRRANQKRRFRRLKGVLKSIGCLSVSKALNRETELQ